ncbi:MAG: hypothetical protein WC179_05090 [Candidatus Cloacimonadaceae bacterium]
MLELLKEDLQKNNVFSGELPPIVRKVVDSINAPQIPYRFKLTIAVSELILFVSHLRRNILHWNGSSIPINAISFVIAGSGSGKDSSVSAARKCFSEGYKIIDTKRKAIATQNAIKSAMLAGKPDPEEYNTYKEFYTAPNPLFVAPSTAEGFIQHLNDLDSAGIGAGYTQSGEFGAELVSGGLIVDNIKLLAEIYDEGTKEVKVLKSRENQSKEIKGLPVSALYMGSQDNLLYDESIKRVFRREFSTKLARRSFFTFTPKMEDPREYSSVIDMIEAEARDEDTATKARLEVQSIIKDIATEAVKGAGQPLKVSEEVRSLFVKYKRYNEEFSHTMNPQYPISKIVRMHMQWKAFKVAGALAILRGSNTIEIKDYISAISYCESISSDMETFEAELVKEPYEIFVDFMKSIAIDGKASIGLHKLRKLGYIPTTGIPTTKMKELIHLASSYDKSGLYTIAEDSVCYEAIIPTDIIGASYKPVSGTKEQRSSQCSERFEFYETKFNELSLMLQEDLAYSPFRFKDGKRGKDNIIGGCKWICLDIDDSNITDEECHFILQDINHHIARTSDINNPFKFRVLLELDAIVDIPDIQWRQFIKSISESLSIKTDLLPKSQIYFSYSERKVLSVIDQNPIEVREHLMLATSTEDKPQAYKPTSQQAKALLNNPLSTFAYAFEASRGEGSRSLIRAAYHAKDLGMQVDDIIDLMYEISNYWDTPLDNHRMEKTIIAQIKRWE